MNAGEIIRYQMGEIGVESIANSPEELDIGMNELGASCNAGTTLIAVGGPCPIVVFRRADLRLGGIIHISGENAEADGDDHEGLISCLLDTIPEFNADAQVCICFDPTPAPGVELPADMDDSDVAEQAELRVAFVEKVEQHLQSLGFHDIVRLTEGIGKEVQVNTLGGTFMFLDHANQFLDPPGEPWFSADDLAADDNGAE